MKKIKGFKAFNKGLKCRNFQFKENKIFEQSGELTICENGFHFCENPMDVMDYYDITDCEFAEVESLGKTQTQENKTVTNKIKIGVKLGLSAFIKASFNFLWEKTGKRDKNNIVDSGYYSQVATSGNSSQVEITAKNSIGASIGKNSKVSGIIDTWIVLSEIDDNGDIKEVKTAKIDGTILKENTFYQLINGEFTEVK